VKKGKRPGECREGSKLLGAVCRGILKGNTVRNWGREGKYGEKNNSNLQRNSIASASIRIEKKGR